MKESDLLRMSAWASYASLPVSVCSYTGLYLCLYSLKPPYLHIHTHVHVLEMWVVLVRSSFSLALLVDAGVLLRMAAIDACKLSFVCPAPCKTRATPNRIQHKKPASSLQNQLDIDWQSSTDELMKQT